MINLHLNDVPIVKTSSQKHLGLNIDTKLMFNDHINEKIVKAMKGVGRLRKPQCFLRRSSLLTINKFFIKLTSRLWIRFI